MKTHSEIVIKSQIHEREREKGKGELTKKKLDMWSQAMICINITFSTNNMSNRLAGHHHDNLYKGCRSHPDYKLFSPCLHHMHIHACLKTCTNTCTFTHINIQKHASTYSDMSTHKYSKIWKHIFTLQILVMYIYSYTHTHTYMHFINKQYGQS